MFYQIARQM